MSTFLATEAGSIEKFGGPYLLPGSTNLRGLSRTTNDLPTDTNTDSTMQKLANLNKKKKKKKKNNGQGRIDISGIIELLYPLMR